MFALITPAQQPNWVLIILRWRPTSPSEYFPNSKPNSPLESAMPTADTLRAKHSSGTWTWTNTWGMYERPMPRLSVAMFWPGNTRINGLHDQPSSTRSSCRRAPCACAYTRRRHRRAPTSYGRRGIPCAIACSRLRSTSPTLLVSAARKKWETCRSRNVRPRPLIGKPDSASEINVQRQGSELVMSWCTIYHQQCLSINFDFFIFKL